MILVSKALLGPFPFTTRRALTLLLRLDKQGLRLLAALLFSFTNRIEEYRPRMRASMRLYSLD